MKQMIFSLTILAACLLSLQTRAAQFVENTDRSQCHGEKALSLTGSWKMSWALQGAQKPSQMALNLSFDSQLSNMKVSCVYQADKRVEFSPTTSVKIKEDNGRIVFMEDKVISPKDKAAASCHANIRAQTAMRYQFRGACLEVEYMGNRTTLAPVK